MRCARLLPPAAGRCRWALATLPPAGRCHPPRRFPPTTEYLLTAFRAYQNKFYLGRQYEGLEG